MSKEKKNYLTREWYEKLVKELHELKNIKLPAVLERLAEAKAMWDLSENFEYKSAMEDKDFINSKITEIEELIDDVEIIDEDSKKTSWAVVDYWSVVTLEIEWDKQYTVTIVGTWEIWIDDWLKVSFESPLWACIKGKKAWDEVKMRIANWRKSVKIIKVK